MSEKQVKRIQERERSELFTLPQVVAFAAQGQLLKPCDLWQVSLDTQKEVRRDGCIHPGSRYHCCPSLSQLDFLFTDFSLLLAKLLDSRQAGQQGRPVLKAIALLESLL